MHLRARVTQDAIRGWLRVSERCSFRTDCPEESLFVQPVCLLNARTVERRFFPHAVADKWNRALHTAPLTRAHYCPLNLSFKWYIPTTNRFHNDEIIVIDMLFTSLGQWSGRYKENQADWFCLFYSMSSQLLVHLGIKSLPEWTGCYQITNIAYKQVSYETDTTTNITQVN